VNASVKIEDCQVLVKFEKENVDEYGKGKRASLMLQSEVISALQ
jgi:hypothetical protein